MSKTITIEIPAPPDGWVYEKRIPKEGEAYLFYHGNSWRVDSKGIRRGQDDDFFDNTSYAYRVRDEYAERYEALNLPDGWAMTFGQGTTWHSNPPPIGYVASSLRRIVNGKAIRP